ncbi:MAG: hypothetical protein U1F67_07140 [Rubrivivax sp.]
MVVGGRLIDPTHGIDGAALDIGIRAGRVAAVGATLPPLGHRARRRCARRARPDRFAHARLPPRHLVRRGPAGDRPPLAGNDDGRFAGSAGAGNYEKAWPSS